MSAQASSVAGTTLVAAVIVASLVSLPRAYARPKQDFDGALRFIDASRAPDEPVLTGGLARYPYRRLYGRRWTEVVTRGDLRAVGPGARRVWMVYSFPEYMDRELVDVIRRGCRPARVFPGTLGGGDVHVCTFEGSPGGAGGMENFDRLFP